MITIFLPAYNEEIALPRLVKKFDEVLRREDEAYKIVVFDDGSADRTTWVAEGLAKQYPMEVLRHEKNRGLGEIQAAGGL